MKTYDKPFKPLFIFDFEYSYKPKKYGAVFVKKDDKIHIMSKVYNLS